jgi:hypothetical protein
MNPPSDESLTKARDRAEVMLHDYEVYLLKALRSFGEEIQRALEIEDPDARALAVSGIGAVAVQKMAKKIGMIVGVGAMTAGNEAGLSLERYLQANLIQTEETIRAVASEYIKVANSGLEN